VTRELKGRTPLSFIVDQLVKPLASVLARERGIEFDEGQALLAILADEGIAKEVQAIHGIETKNDRKPRKATEIEEEQDYESEPEADYMQEDGDGLVEEEAEDRMKEVSEEDTLNEEEVAPPTPRKLASTRRYANRIESTSASPPPAEPPARSRKKRETSAADDEPSPPKPTPMLTTSQQRSKKEREKEEEEELEKRREEMRKRMGAGGGGRLGKRRFGR